MIIKSKSTRINEKITAVEVRLIDSDGEQVGIVTRDEALAKAAEKELDLVEISPEAEPPVCRIMDHGKFVYDLSKKRTKAKRNQKKTKVKELKLRPGTDEGDYEVKLRNLIKFLDHGDKVKITLRFRGREMAHQELGLKLLQRVEHDIAEQGVVEQRPKLEGRQMVMVIAPKKK